MNKLLKCLRDFAIAYGEACAKNNDSNNSQYVSVGKSSAFIQKSGNITAVHCNDGSSVYFGRIGNNIISF